MYRFSQHVDSLRDGARSVEAISIGQSAWFYAAPKRRQTNWLSRSRVP